MTKFQLATWLVSSAALVSSTFAFAEPQVVQSQADADNTSQPRVLQVASNGNNDQAMAELLFQFQTMQQEMMDLRGQVEELLFQIQQMKQDSKDRYIDLDRRISELQTGGTIVTPGQNQATQQQSEEDREMVKAAYNAAKDLIRQKEFAKAVTAFQQLVVEHPNSEYVANSYYWMGEVYMVIPDVEAARAAFLKVVREYSNHQKHPDATYKLGVAYEKLGDKNKARQYYQQVIKDYPQAQAARRAKAKLDKL